jgi:hypothetical protein
MDTSPFLAELREATQSVEMEETRSVERALCWALAAQMRGHRKVTQEKTGPRERPQSSGFERLTN